MQAYSADALRQGDEEMRSLKRLWSVAMDDADVWSESYIKARFRAAGFLTTKKPGYG